MGASSWLLMYHLSFSCRNPARPWAGENTACSCSAKLNSDADLGVCNFVSILGIISLCRPNGKGVQSLLGVFCLPNSDVRVTKKYLYEDHNSKDIQLFMTDCYKKKQKYN